MNLPFKIAARYFKGRHGAQAINIVSWISMGAVAFSTMAMVVLFSVFNGLESYVKDLYTAFYPELKISPNKGKFFDVDSSKIAKLKVLDGIKTIGLSVEDMALLDGVDHQKVVRLKGVDDHWFQANVLEPYISTGTASWPKESMEVPSSIGVNIVAEMGIEMDNPFRKIQLYYPKSNASFVGINAASALNGMAVVPYSSFQVKSEVDGMYILIPLAAAQDFFDVEHKISNIDITLKNPKQEKQVKAAVMGIMGGEYKVLSRLEQNKTLFMATQMEKWMIYGILSLVLVIASFNLVGALSMLAIEKKIDVSMLKSMGADGSMIRKLFLQLGMLITGIGAVVGLVLGLVIVLVQMYWAPINIAGEGSEPYPVKLDFFDFVVVCATVIVVGLLAGWYPANKTAKQAMIFRDE